MKILAGRNLKEKSLKDSIGKKSLQWKKISIKRLFIGRNLTQYTPREQINLRDFKVKRSLNILITRTHTIRIKLQRKMKNLQGNRINHQDTKRIKVRRETKRIVIKLLNQHKNQAKK